MYCFFFLYSIFNSNEHIIRFESICFHCLMLVFCRLKQNGMCIRQHKKKYLTCANIDDFFVLHRNAWRIGQLDRENNCIHLAKKLSRTKKKTQTVDNSFCLRAWTFQILHAVFIWCVCMPVRMGFCIHITELYWRSRAEQKYNRINQIWHAMSKSSEQKCQKKMNDFAKKRECRTVAKAHILCEREREGWIQTVYACQYNGQKIFSASNILITLNFETLIYLSDPVVRHIQTNGWRMSNRWNRNKQTKNEHRFILERWSAAQ